MKVAPVHRAIANRLDWQQVILHTGQHYDTNMSAVFFKQLGIPEPSINLQVGSGSHAQQTAEVISRFEPALLEEEPGLVVVYGDVNSTVAAALVCSKLGVRVAHVEAGLRSFDRTMPEEINRLVTDQLSDLLFTPSEDGNRNLAREGIPCAKIHFVGNVMIDTLVRLLPTARQCCRSSEPFVLVTLHRPSNVDDPAWLSQAAEELIDISRSIDVIFPVHPRTRRNLEEQGLASNCAGIQLSDPLPYLDFIGLLAKAKAVITDSGGIQEEASFLGIPCLTMRENTERPITVELGTNQLVGRDLHAMRVALDAALSSPGVRRPPPPLWDGHAAERIADILGDV